VTRYSGNKHIGFITLPLPSRCQKTRRLDHSRLVKEPGPYLALHSYCLVNIPLLHPTFLPTSKHTLLIQPKMKVFPDVILKVYKHCFTNKTTKHPGIVKNVEASQNYVIKREPMTGFQQKTRQIWERKGFPWKSRNTSL